MNSYGDWRRKSKQSDLYKRLWQAVAYANDDHVGELLHDAAIAVKRGQARLKLADALSAAAQELSIGDFDDAWKLRWDRLQNAVRDYQNGVRDEA